MAPLQGDPPPVVAAPCPLLDELMCPLCRRGPLERDPMHCAGGAGWRRTSWGFDLLDGRAWSTPAHVSNELDVVAMGYESWRRRSLSLLTGTHFPLAAELALAIDLLPPAGTCVDLACSTALYGRAIAGQPQVSMVYAVDMAESMLKVARRAVGREGLADRLVLLRARGQQLPFTDGTVDRVYCGGSLNEMGDAPGVFQETRRVLTDDGGALFMVLLQAASRRGRLAQALAGRGGIRFFTPEELTGLALQAGLALTQFEVFGAVGFVVVRPA